MQETLRQKQKEEALKRMDILKFASYVKRDFKTKDLVYYSERQNQFFNAVLYWVTNEEEYVQLINHFEEEYNALVYHLQLTHTEFGDQLSIFYVSQHEEEWDMDKNDLREGYAMVRVENLPDDIFSEFGTIGIKPSMGGVVRTA